MNNVMSLEDIIQFVELKKRYHKQMDNRTIARELSEIEYLLECFREELEESGSKEQSIWISNYQNVNNNEMIACATRTDFVTHYLTLTLTRSAPSTSPEHNNTRNGVDIKRLYFFAQKQVNVYYFYRE